MKRLIAAVVLLLIVAAFTTTNFIISEHHYKKMTALVTQSAELYKEGKKTAAAEKATAAKSHWDKYEKILAVFINREVIDDIGESVTRHEVLAKSADDALFLAENAICLMLIEHMHDIEQIMIY